MYATNKNFLLHINDKPCELVLLFYIATVLIEDYMSDGSVDIISPVRQAIIILQVVLRPYHPIRDDRNNHFPC